MKLGAQEEYGLRCLLQVAKAGNGGSVTIHEISQAEGLSVPNVAKLMRLLRLGGLVQSTRGQSGGYELATSASKITHSEVLVLFGGPLYSLVFCERHAGTGTPCAHSTDCSIRPVWRTLQQLLSGVLEQITLQDLLCDENEMLRRISVALGVMSKQREPSDYSVATAS